MYLEQTEPTYAFSSNSSSVSHGEFIFPDHYNPLDTSHVSRLWRDTLSFATLQNYYPFRFIGCKGHGIASRGRWAIHMLFNRRLGRYFWRQDERGELVWWSSLSDEMALEDNWWLRKSSVCVDCGRRVAATRIFTFPTARKKNTPFSDGANWRLGRIERRFTEGSSKTFFLSSRIYCRDKFSFDLLNKLSGWSWCQFLSVF